MSRQTGIILTVVSVLFVGCPSCFCLLFGLLTALGQGTYELGADTGQLPPAAGFGILCLGLLGWLIPLAVWYFTMHRNRAVV